jgi:hypothetical protein
MPLRELARAEIAALEAEGITPTWDEAAQLNDLAAEVELPGRTDPAGAGEPIRAGNCVFWPFTLSSGEWFGYVVRAGIFTTRDGSRNALAFALCNGRTPEVFADLITSDDCRAAVNRWVLRAGITAAERENALVRVVPELGNPHTTSKDGADGGETVDGIIAELVVGSGLPADYWRGQLQSHAVKCLRAISRQSAAGVGLGADDETAYRQANAKLMIVSDKIRKAHRGES